MGHLFSMAMLVITKLGIARNSRIKLCIDCGLGPGADTLSGAGAGASGDC